jgi:large subunit ribosomal protein L25
MTTVELKAKVREDLGKGSARKARKDGWVPAVLYGEGEESRSLSVSYKDFYPVIHTAARENVILDLTIEGAKGPPPKAIIREIQHHPVSREILHVDFQHISMTKEITVNVHVEVIGESVGVKASGGVLELILREIEVECLPANIPDKIDVDVTALEVGDSIQVKDLEVADARITSDPDSTVITIVAPTVIEEKKVEVAAEGEEEVPEEGEEKEGEKPKEGEGETEKKAE